MISLLIVAVVWLGCAVLDASIMINFWRRRWPELFEPRDVARDWFMALAMGPLSLVASALFFLLQDTPFYGVGVPWFTKADRALMRRARL